MAVENHGVPFLMAVRYIQEFTDIWLWKIMMSFALWQSDTNRKSSIYGCAKSLCPFPYGTQKQTGIHRYMSVQNDYVPCLMAVRYKQEFTDIIMAVDVAALAA